MKKILQFILLSTLPLTSNALTVYQDQSSSLEFDGSLRLIMEKSSVKYQDEHGNKINRGTDSSSTLRNAGTRFNFRIKHKLDSNNYVIGRLDFRVDREANNSDRFGDFYTRRAYVGFGNTKYGELTFGKQATVANDLGFASSDYYYGIIPDYLPTSGRSVIRYDYKIDNLQLSANYQFAEARDANNRVLPMAIRQGYTAGAVYRYRLFDYSVIMVDGGISRIYYEPSKRNTSKQVVTAYRFDIGYLVGKYKFGFDTSYAKGRDPLGDVEKYYFSPGVRYQVNSIIDIYSNYLWERENRLRNSVDSVKHKNGILIGSSFKVRNSVVFYVEGIRTKAKTKEPDRTVLTETEFSIGIGTRVYW